MIDERLQIGIHFVAMWNEEEMIKSLSIQLLLSIAYITSSGTPYMYGSLISVILFYSKEINCFIRCPYLVSFLETLNWGGAEMFSTKSTFQNLNIILSL